MKNSVRRTGVMEEVLIVHGGIDGIASAVLAIANNYPADIYFLSANEIKPQSFSRYKYMTIVDMAISEEQLKEIIQSGKVVRIYDHHSRNHYINKYPGCVMDSRSCATKLFYINELFLNHNPCSERFVEMVDIVDRWQVFDEAFDECIKLLHLFNGTVDKANKAISNPSSKSNQKPISHLASKCLYKNGKIQPSKYFEFINLCETKLLMLPNKPFPFTIEEISIIEDEEKKLHDDYIRTYITIQIRMDEYERLFGLCEIHGNPSIVLARILKRNLDMDYIIAYEQSSGPYTRVYARSRDVDVDMNKLKGLEGHPTASGGMIKTTFINDLKTNKIHYIASEKSGKHKFQRGLTPHEMLVKYMK